MASFIFSDWFTSCFDWNVSVGVSFYRKVHVRLYQYKQKIIYKNVSFMMLIEHFTS